MTIDAERLTAACGELASEAGIKIQTVLEPLGGSGTTVKPAIYPGPAFQEDWRWWGEPDGTGLPTSSVPGAWAKTEDVPVRTRDVYLDVQRSAAFMSLPQM